MTPEHSLPSPRPSTVTRRSLLGAAAGGATALAYGGLPAWAKPVAQLAGVRRPESLPFPKRPAGTESMPQIKHVVVLMMENHSFDNLLGMVPHRVPGRTAVDGFTLKHGLPVEVNPNTDGSTVPARPMSSPCQLVGHPGQDWNASHVSFNGGRNDGFVKASGPVAMSFWDDTDLPFTYSLVKHFPMGNRYFCSVLAQTYPNRRFLFCGTSSGLVATNSQSFSVPAANGTFFDRLDQHHISWASYYQQVPSEVIVPGFLTAARKNRVKKIDEFFTHAHSGKLPAFTFLDPNYDTTSEENPQDIQVGERFVAKVVKAILHSPAWQHTAFFLTYDEHGGYYDHVPPPRAIKPDSTAPIPVPGQAPLLPGAFDRYGFRVPTVVVSPWARANYVSNVVQDHTSITAFIEHKWNLPAMTFRDANAHPMTDYFDFTAPAFATPPRLAAAPGLAHGLGQCHAAGLNPPLP
ncbi:MAG TPA: alkaline phosphatase family protein [Solirubrobacteraceae bacterium]|jgi:phospholipase C|nr:alkaline phosphatase family protein [Solirubrobacteraceae bacterium]